MVLFALEQALAAYIQAAVDQRGAAPRGIVKDVAKRHGLASPTVPSILPLTYLGDLVAAVSECAQDSPHAEAAERLQKLFDIFELYDIRNAVAHPNRDFPSHYWYRAKAIAADPVLQQLGLNGVHRALVSAMSGELREPPEEWVASLRWRLPSNLPVHFEHEITGLMGRKKDRDELLRLLRNPKLNLVAVVAPGGVGKTALLLDCLREIEGSPKDAEWVDQIVWVTGKTHALSAAGEQRIAPDVTLDELGRDIAGVLLRGQASLGEAITQLGDKHILLAVDNLESLVRDSPQEFNEFYRSLPHAWRVVVTSRVLVDSATTLSLQPLTRGGAIGLVGAYSKWKGAGQLPEPETIVERCGFNPLAIRIVIDGFAAGGSLVDLLPETRQNLIAYSFKFLTDRLALPQRRVLESLFASDTALGRVELGAFLDGGVDEVASALSTLLKTSLVSRVSSPGEERYELNAGIRELLLVEPLEMSFRQRCVEKRRKDRILRLDQRTKQLERGVGPLSPYFVPESSLSEADGASAFKITAALRSRSTTRADLAKLLEELQVREERGPMPGTLHRLSGLLLMELGDRTRGLLALRKAAGAAPYDVPASELAARELAREGELAASIALTQRLIDDGWAEPERVGEAAAAQIRRHHWVHRIWNKDSAAVASETTDWEAMGYLASHAGLVHAQALHRAVEHKYGRNDYSALEGGLAKSADAFDRLIELHGAGGSVAREVQKLIEQLAYAARAKNYTPSESAKRTFLSFVERRLPEICDVSRDLDWDSDEVDRMRRAIGRWGPLKFQRGTDSHSHRGGVREGALRARVSQRPSRATYLFARDEGGIEYFVPKSGHLGSSDEWESLTVGTWLLVWPGEPMKGKATPATRSKREE